MHSYPTRQPLVVYYAILSSTLRLCDGRRKLLLSQGPSARFQSITRAKASSSATSLVEFLELFAQLLGLLSQLFQPRFQRLA
jgi:hypothetical protein